MEFCALVMLECLRSDLWDEKLSVPSYPPLWTKPAASIAHPGEDIPINDFCAKSLLDYEASTLILILRNFL